MKRAVFGRDDPPTTLRDLRRIADEEWDNLDQQDLDELVDSITRRIHQCMKMCYWVLEVLVYAATWNTNSNLQFLVFMRVEMLFLSISIPFECKGSGTLRTEVMQFFFVCNNSFIHTGRVKAIRPSLPLNQALNKLHTQSIRKKNTQCNTSDQMERLNIS